MQMSQLPLDLLRIITHFLSDIIVERNGKFITTMRKDDAIYKKLFDNFRYRVMINNHELLGFNSKRYHKYFPPKFDNFYFLQLIKQKLNLDEKTMKFYNNNIIEFLLDYDIYMRKAFENGKSIQMLILSIHKF